MQSAATQTPVALGFSSLRPPTALGTVSEGYCDLFPGKENGLISSGGELESTLFIHEQLPPGSATQSHLPRHYLKKKSAG